VVEPNLADTPHTAAAQMLRALARRDRIRFVHWRTVLKQTDNRDLGPTLTSVIRSVVRRRFKPTDVPEVIRFLGRDRVPVWSDLPLDVLKAEAYIRSILGEPGLTDDLTGRELTDIAMQLLPFIVEDLSMSDQELDAILIEAERYALTRR
jgi:hypothetical protein